MENVIVENNKDKIILDLCGGTGSWSKPYKDAGYDVRIVTLPECDVRQFFLKPDEIIYGILAAPPCTMFSLARTKAKKPRNFAEGMEVVEACLNLIWAVRKHDKLAFWAMENPMGYLRQFMGKPAFTFDPSEFGEDYNKTTDIWGYFKEPKKLKPYTRFDSTDKNTRKLPTIPEEYKPDPNMSNLQIRRSITAKGFAQAFFKANQ
jgi:hypothetical protein